MIKADLDKKLNRLLREYGYEMQGNTIIRLGIAYMPSEIWGKASSLFDACERLIPIISDKAFSSEFRRLTKING